MTSLVRQKAWHKTKDGIAAMTRILRIDRAMYEVDDKTKTYRYFGRNPDWKELYREENERNKIHIDGYTRIFRDSKTKKFRYRK